MQDPNIINPLTNPIFAQVVQRFIWLFVEGFVLIFLLNKFKLLGIWKTNLGERYLGWLIIGFLFMFFIFLGGIPSIIFLFLIMALAIWEIGKISKLPKIYPYFLYILAAISIIVTSYFPDKFYMLPIIYFTILTTLTVRRNDKKGFFNLAVSFYYAIWIIFFLSHFILLGHLNNDFDSTKSLLLLIGFAVPLADIGAYVVGKAFSKTFLNKYKIASNISPNKIWAGALGNIFGAGIGIGIMYFAIKNYFSITQLIFLAIIIGVFSVIGDMNESLVKRYFNVKDASNIIPGHGGILDRIDYVMRVIVVVYYFSLIVI